MDGWSSPAFEFVDIEIIDHKKEDEKSLEKWDCDLCSLFFLSEEKLQDHKKNHLLRKELSVHCRYCNKTLSSTEESKESYLNKKCDTCEYKCSKCPQRFLRHSSLLNHEKNHSSCKKKILNSDATNNGTLASKKRVTKKRRADQIIQGEIEISIDAIKKEAGRFNKSNVSPKKKKKMLSDEAVSLKQAKKSNVETLSDSKKMSKRSSRGGNKQIEEKGSKIKSNQNHVMSNSLLNVKTPSTPANPNNENVVNYKPFSCHVCGDTFASENGLLVHIKSHGESAASTFKCKFCGDQFEDIYKMQYHLAICPLAEDELESSFKQSIPPKYLMKNASNSESTLFQPRKRGRPRKSDKDDTMNDVNSKNTKSLSTTAKAKFRKNNTPKEFQKTSGSLSTSLRSKSAQANRKKALDVVGTELNFEGKHDHIDGNDQYVKHGEDYLEASNDLLNESSDTVGDRKVHACPFPHCNFKFSRETAMLCHLRNHNDDFDDTLKCHKCGIPYDDIHSLRIHLNTCKGLQDEKDDDLNDPGYSDDSVDKTFLKKTRGTFVCKQCGKGHNSQESLNRCFHKTPENIGLICRLCNEECDGKESLMNHFISTHPEKMPYQCSICLAEFDSDVALSNHRQSHENDKNFQCDICLVKLPSYKDLYFHYSEIHASKSDNICDICYITFPTEMALEEHILIHKGEEPFKCTLCSKSFNNRMNLESHLKLHEIKIYKCKICYRPFTDRDVLLKHMLYHASTCSERQFKCCLCSTAYNKKWRLKDHIMNFHVGNELCVKECPVCSATIEHPNSMACHIMQHCERIAGNKMSKIEVKWIKSKKHKQKEICLSPKMGISGKSVKIENEDSITNIINTEVLGNKINESCLRLRELPITHIKTEHKIEVSCIKQKRESPKKLKTQENYSTTNKVKRKRGRPRKYFKPEDLKFDTSVIIAKDSENDLKRCSSQINGRESVSFRKEIENGKDDKKDVLHHVRRTRQSVKIMNVDNSLLEKLNPRSLFKKGSNFSNEKQTLSQASPVDIKKEDLEMETDSIYTSITNNDVSLETKSLPMSFKFVTSLSSAKHITKTVRKSWEGGITLKNEKNNYNVTKLPSVTIKEENPLLHVRDKMKLKHELNEKANQPNNSLEKNRCKSTPCMFLSDSEESIEQEENICVDGILKTLSYIEPENLDFEKTTAKKEKVCFNENQYNSIEQCLKKEDQPLQKKTNDSEKSVITSSSCSSQDYSNFFIKEEKFFEPIRDLSKYSCTTCMLSFISQEELLLHNSSHI